jgi:hypothetical protein
MCPSAEDSFRGYVVTSMILISMNITQEVNYGGVCTNTWEAPISIERLLIAVLSYK